MRPTRTELALLISMLGAGLTARVDAGELTMADLCSVPSASGCVDHEAGSGVVRPTPRVVAARTLAEAEPIGHDALAVLSVRELLGHEAGEALVDAAAASSSPAIAPKPAATLGQREPSPPSKDEPAHAMIPSGEGPRPVARRGDALVVAGLDATPPPDGPPDAGAKPPSPPVRVPATPAQASPGAQAFVASHADKVLLNLLTVTSRGDAGDLMERPGDAIVVGASEGDRVLSNLASVLSSFEPASPSEPERASDLDGPTVDLLLEIASTPSLDIDLDLPADAPAEGVLPREPGLGPVAVNDAELDAMRGGFTTPDGLKVAFGIERAVYVNGSLVTSTSLNVTAAGATGAPAAVASGGALALVQNGSGNAFLSGTVPPGSMGTVIQNTLNDQKIQNLTVINATVNSLQVLRDMNLQSALRSAVIDSLRR